MATAGTTTGDQPAAQGTSSPHLEPSSSSSSPIIAADDDNTNDNDDDNGDTDSAVDSNSLGSTDSVTSSILDYRKLHNRTYANSKTTEYWGPNDEPQNEAFDLIHNALTMLLGDRLYLAPINPQSPGRVLDIGTGTGIWAMDFADECPNAEVVGTDLSPIQPSWVPPNLEFVIDDCTLDWTWPESHFDYVHLRIMYGCIPDWTALDKKILQHLKPGGWMEHLEIGCEAQSDHVDFSQTGGGSDHEHVFKQWAQLFYQGGDKIGRPFTICLDGAMKKHMEEAGFVNIQEHRFKLPVSAWPKDATLKQAGFLFNLALERDMEGAALFLATQALGWTREEVTLLVSQMRRELRKKSNCPWITVNVVCGQRPS